MTRANKSGRGRVLAAVAVVAAAVGTVSAVTCIVAMIVFIARLGHTRLSGNDPWGMLALYCSYGAVGCLLLFWWARGRLGAKVSRLIRAFDTPPTPVGGSAVNAVVSDVRYAASAPANSLVARSSVGALAAGPRAGWYRDPEDAHFLRWWDGERWTEARASHSERH